MCRLYTTVCVVLWTHLICPFTNGLTVSTLQNFMQYNKIYIILISVHEYMQSPVSVCVVFSTAFNNKTHGRVHYARSRDSKTDKR